MQNREMTEHEAIVALMNEFGYPKRRGICEGGIMSSLQSLYIDDSYEQTTINDNRGKQIKELCQKHKGPKAAAFYLKKALKAIANKDPSIDAAEAQAVIDICAYMDVIEINFNASLYKDVIGKVVMQGQSNTLLPYTAPLALEKKGQVVKVKSWLGIYTYPDLLRYLQDLETNLLTFNKKLSLILRSGTHTIKLSLHPFMQKWILRDMNLGGGSKGAPFKSSEIIAKCLHAMFQENINFNDATTKKEVDKNPLAFDTSLCAFVSNQELEMAGQSVDLCPSIIELRTKLNSFEDAGMFQNRKEHILSRYDLKTNRGYGLIHLASREGYVDIIQLAYDHKLVLNKTNFRKESPLHIAAQYGHYSIVKLLLESKEFDINAPEGDGKTPLMEAANFGHSKVVELLLAYGANVHLESHVGTTALSSAVKQGHPQVVQLLLNAGADSRLVTKNKMSIVDYAAQSGNVEVLKILLEVKGLVWNDISAQGFSPLHFAIIHGHYHFANLLIQTKLVDINQLTADKSKSPLHIAVVCGHYAIITALLEAGANIELKASNMTPLHLAAVSGEDVSFMQLLKAGAILDIQILLDAVKNNHANIIAAAIKADRKDILQSANEAGLTVGMYCIMMNKPNIFAMLLNAGIDLEKEKNQAKEMFQKSNQGLFKRPHEPSNDDKYPDSKSARMFK